MSESYILLLITVKRMSSVSFNDFWFSKPYLHVCGPQFADHLIKFVSFLDTLRSFLRAN